MIQSDPDREFPTEVFKFILNRQAEEAKDMIPHDQCLQERILMINHYKNQELLQQKVATQIPMNIAQECQNSSNDKLTLSLQNHS